MVAAVDGLKRGRDVGAGGLRLMSACWFGRDFLTPLVQGIRVNNGVVSIVNNRMIIFISGGGPSCGPDKKRKARMRGSQG